MGFIGFKFNNGAGVQYGWARIVMEGKKAKNGFKVLDYAYGDPGEPVWAGQNASDQQPSDQVITRDTSKGSESEAVPKGGSLAWLAVGAAGLLAWRKSRRAA